MGIKPVVDKVHVDENIGSYAPARHYIGSSKAEGTLNLDGLYQEVPYIIAMAMGAESPAGGGDPYTWTWALPDTTPETFSLWTVEYTDGDVWVLHAVDVFATGLTISAEAGKSWQFEAPLVGGEITYISALGASLSPGTTLTAIRMADTVLSIDNTYAGIGVTPVSNALINFSWGLENLQHQKLFAGSLWPSGRGNAKWQVTLEMTVEVATAVFESERDKHLTKAQTAVHLKATSGAHSATIAGMFMLEDVASLEERDGNNIVTFSYLGEMDASDNTGYVEVLSSLDAL